MELQRWRKQSLFLAASSLLQPSGRVRAFPGVTQHRPDQKRTCGLDPWVPSFHRLQGMMSQKAGNQKTAYDWQRDFGWAQSGRLFTELRKKAGVGEMVHSTFSPSPKAWCLQHKEQKWRRSSSAGGKIPMTKPVQCVPCLGPSLH